MLDKLDYKEGVMKSETLEALQKSIIKWEKRADGCYSDTNDYCPLCELFNPHRIKADYSDCRGCPVMESTGKEFCHDTPYIEWYKFNEELEEYDTLEELEDISKYSEEIKRIKDEFAGAAEQEVRFLKSLLPEVDH
jgi:hypothetical protein